MWVPNMLQASITEYLPLLSNHAAEQLPLYHDYAEEFSAGADWDGIDTEALNDEMAYLNNRNSSSIKDCLALQTNTGLTEPHYEKFVAAPKTLPLIDYNPYYSRAVTDYYRFLFRLTPF